MTDPFEQWDPFSEEPDDDDELVACDECVCSECGQTFILPQGYDIDRCPVCDIPFDSKGS